ncbi:MAG: dTDP-4-dehydrorhamnose 3,5-epimerase family protein [bacterium]|nr:dTDP-4-dehydrorhamnose 3,5-epimerase family protein [bacterium]
MEEIKIFEGGLSVDDRGTVTFVNGFTFAGVKRFYSIRNHRKGFVRAWHAHRKEGKYVAMFAGSALIGAVPIDNWDHPAKDAKVFRVVLSSAKPSIVYIPPGYANGAMSLSDDAIIVYFSTASMEETKGDDVRYDARYWDIWNIEER